MSPDQIVKALKWMAQEAEFMFAAETLNAAAALIESLQAQLADKTALLDAAIAGQRTLQAQLSAQQSNEPLTLDELRGMDGEPVYTITIGVDSVSCEIVGSIATGPSGKEIMDLCNLEDGQYEVYADTYGKTWLAYRRPPERSEDA